MHELQVLDIACKSLADLRSSVQLPQLAELTLRLRLDQILILDWVEKQQYGQLKLHLEIWARRTFPHMAVMRQLKRLNISQLIVSDCMGHGRGTMESHFMARCAEMAAGKHFKLEVLR